MDPLSKEAAMPAVPKSSPIQKKSFFRKYLPHYRISLWLVVIVIIGLVGGGYYFYRIHHTTNQTISRGAVQVKSASAVNYFSVVSISPSDNSSGSPEDTPITLTFSEPVRPDSLRGFFTVSPMIPGDFTQGTTPNQVVFKARYPFGKGTSVKVILNKGLESIAGDKLTADFTFNFYTKTLDDKVEFENDSIYSRWTNLAVGKGITFNLTVGSDISPDGSITVYKGTFDEIVSSLLYTNESHDNTNYVTQTYLDYPVDTTKMVKVSQTKGIKRAMTFAFQQPEGLYYIEAKSDGKVVGSTWVNVTDEGLIVRQDDQKLVVAAQNTKTGEVSSQVKVLLYNLENKPTLLQVSTIQGSGEIPVAYPQKVDLVVGQTDQGVILAPLTIPDTQADIRVTSNLSTTAKIFLQTDRPTYSTSASVKFSGVVRLDNDAQYSLPNSGQAVRVWVPDPNDITKKLIDQTVPLGDGGTFSGQFAIPALLNFSGDTSQSLTLYANTVSDGTLYVSSKSYTTFDVLPDNQTGTITVSFDKQTYLKNEKVTAHITGLDASGDPMANQQLTYSVYAKNYYESDEASVASFGNDWGEQTKLVNQPITLDKNGQASIPIDESDETVSQAITLLATTSNGQKVSGAKTILVQQGNIVLTFGSSRDEYQSGDTTLSRVYARDLSGNSLANLPLQYEIYTSTYDYTKNQYKETVLHSGTVTTDENGFVLISQPVTANPGTVTIRVTAKDSSDNSVQAERSLTILAADESSSAIYYHELTLSNLDVATDKLHYTVGDNAALTIAAPYDQNVLVTYERGRIYHSEWLQLHKGSNSYHIPITSELAPSFTIVFSYFHDGVLNIEGLALNVANPSENLVVSPTTDKTTYAKNDSALFSITTKDSNGQPVKTHVTVDIIDEGIFGLRNSLPNGDIGWYFYNPRDITTNFSASTLGIGTGGGCGGGSGTDIQYIPNRLGTTLYWNPSVITDDSGNAVVSVPLASTGKFRVLVTASSDATAVGQAQTAIAVH